MMLSYFESQFGTKVNFLHNIIHIIVLLINIIVLSEAFNFTSLLTDVWFTTLFSYSSMHIAY